MDEVICIVGAEGRLALEWFEENQMKANPDKFQGILFGHTATETEISLGDSNIIKSSENVDLLRLIIDSKLNFSKHIQTTTQKASLKLIALRRLSKRLDPEVRLDYGQTFVLSKYLYCHLVWHFCSHHDVLIMENVQKRLLRNVYEDYESSYDELLLKSKLATLEVQRHRFIATEVYKAVNKLTPIYIQELFEIKELVYNWIDPIRTKVPKCSNVTYDF